jgi:hypothetical protein
MLKLQLKERVTALKVQSAKCYIQEAWTNIVIDKKYTSSCSLKNKMHQLSGLPKQLSLI